MKNPGLSSFAAESTFIRSPSHPLNIDPLEDDPFLEEGDNDSDYMPPVNFGRWRNQGHSTIQVPIYQGPKFPPGKTPEDVIHGEVITDDDRDSADRIMNGEHESDSPSENPFVEHARRDLHTPSSVDAISTLSGLLSGGSPDEVGGIDEAHDYLSHHFTGLRVNPHRGTLVAQSPAGTQVARRKVHLPAIPDQPEESIYSLINRHGTFRSRDPHHLLRSMVAFQIVHNEIARQQQKKKDEEQQDQDNGLVSTSGWREVWDYLRPSTAPGAPPPRPKRVKPTPLENVPESAVFEPGKGIDLNEEHKPGGYVAPEADAPPDWHRDGYGTAYSPGHYMRMILDPAESMQPRSDMQFPGHTITYARNDATGHTVLRRSKSGNFDYWVRDKVHPSTRGEGFDHPPAPPKPKPVSRGGRMPKRGPRIAPHDPPHSLPPSTSAVQVNDLCPVCASGYLEPYDKQHHECLNCGSLVTYQGISKSAAPRPRKPGGLGRGLGQIIPYEGDPLNLGTGGSENPENVPEETPEEGYVHPLAGEEVDPDFEGYQAPRRILDKKAGEVDPLDEHLGKLEFFPIHKPGAARAYVKPDPDIEGAYWRLTEGAPHPETGLRGWALTADHIPSREPWMQGDEPFKGRSITVDRRTNKPGDMKQIRQPLRDLGERVMGEKNIIATGTHPIDDDSLNRAIRDVARYGRNSHTYQRAFMDTAYEPARLPQSGPDKTQRQLRQLSTANPGLSRFSE